jgi:hypothetical protein
MRIENALQARPEYRKTTATPPKTFGQVMEATKAQDRYVSSAPQPRTEPEFSLADELIMALPSATQPTRN